MKYSKGELVKWYMIYDIGIAKDAGIGIIIDCYKYDMFEEPCYTSLPLSAIEKPLDIGAA